MRFTSSNPSVHITSLKKRIVSGVATNPAVLTPDNYELVWDFPNEFGLPVDGSYLAGVRVRATVAGTSQLITPDAKGVGTDLPRITSVSARVDDEGEASGIVLTLNKKLSALKHSNFVLCGVGPKLAELLKITRLDRILTVKPTQREAVRVVP